MQSSVENDLAGAKRRWTEKKFPGNFKLGKQNPSNLLLAMREHQDCIMASIDVKDAFLTVKQEVGTSDMHRCQWKLCAI